MKPKLLIINIFYAPRSFGGATIVAEELAKELSSSFEIYVITSISDDSLYPYNSIRYVAKNVNVIGIKLPTTLSKQDSYINYMFENEISEWIELINPDIIHSHCIQNMGAKYFDTVHNFNIPHILTIHDNWWICKNQFMEHETCKKDLLKMDEDKHYSNSNEYRLKYLFSQLSKVDLLLFPSEFQKQVYSKNISLDSIKSEVNKNGVKFPLEGFKKEKSEYIRFGFVGGIGKDKGSEQILQAFQEINNSKYELILIDNTLNLGFSSIELNTKDFKGRISIVGAYTQESMDDFFSSIDVLLFPSQVKESFGLTIREALVRDIWVVSTDNGGGIEDIVEGKNGNIIPMDKNYITLKNIVEELIKNDFSTYENFNKNMISSYEKQANELKGFMIKLLKGKKNVN